jgi:two-component system alkaline phosphatase synthesis response regulator PhoP
MKCVLVVDDERQIAEIARDYLRHAGFAVITAGDGAAALAMARAQRPDLIVLDLALPRIDGLDVAKALRRESSVPIIMLTARVEEADRLRGLEIGADDYITKPFSPRELVARVKAVLRRVDGLSAGGAAADRIHLADLTLDVPRLKVTRRGPAAGARIGRDAREEAFDAIASGATTIDLTATEFQLLATLARQPGRVFTRAQLLDAVRGVEVESFERAIDAHVKNIRRKLEPDPRAPRYILTVYGIGYKCAES